MGVLTAQTRAAEFREVLGKRVLVADGAMGTMLYSKLNLKAVHRCLDELNLSLPALVRDVHREYAQAGAEILRTNTFGANRPRLGTFGFAEKMRQVNQAGVRIAREAARDQAFVAGSVGPLGVRLEPLGPTTCAEARANFREQIETLVEAGVDLLVLETFRDLGELREAIFAAREAAGPEMVLAAHVSIEDDALIESFTRRLDEWPVDVIGLNCSPGPRGMLDAIEKMIGYTSKPLSAMPSAGLPGAVCSPAYMAQYARRFVRAGVQIVGGCCGTTPAHIRAIRDEIDNGRPGPLPHGHGSEAPPPSGDPAPNPDPTPINDLIPSGDPAPNPDPTPINDLIPSGDPAPNPDPTPINDLIPSGDPAPNPDPTPINDLIPSGDPAPNPDALPSRDREGAVIPLAEKSPLGAKLASGQFVTLAEIHPPRGADASREIEDAKLYQAASIDAVVVSDGPGARLSAPVTAQLIQQQAGIETVLRLSGRGRSIASIQSELMGAHAVGVRNILCTGEDAAAVASIANNLNQGLDAGGNAIGSRTALVLGVEMNPASVEELEIMVRAGAEYVVAQPVFDLDVFEAFLKHAGQYKLPVVAGIWLLTSFRDGEYVINELQVPVPAAYMARMSVSDDGIAIALEMVERVRFMVAGVMLSAPFAGHGMGIQAKVTATLIKWQPT